MAEGAVPPGTDYGGFMRVILLADLGDSAEEAGHMGVARRFFERGAALGDALCCQRLGSIYDRGVGCKPDKRRALYWYKKAWRSRDWCAATNIAILYRENGQHRLEFAWFERAARAGDGDALVEIAKCYLAGVGVPKDRVKAIQCLQRAVALTPYEAPYGITPFGWEEANSMLRDVAM